MLRIAINGYGRIGRNILRALVERDSELRDKIEIVAINDLGDTAVNAHLTRFDSVHGRFPLPVLEKDDHLMVGRHRIRALQERDPARLPWAAMKVDVVCECTGLFTERSRAAAHLDAGAGKVLVSAPGKEMDATVVFGINDGQLSGEERIISNASCTTNCLAPLAAPLHDALGIEKGHVTTIHAYTNDQQLSDAYHPTSTGLALQRNP